MADIYIRFPDGSLKRPDIAIFCREPKEQTGAVRSPPEAVIEILSPGYEQKDLAVGVPFYLSQGVKDIVVFDPATGRATHFALGQERQKLSPWRIRLQCGCSCTV